MDVRGDFLGPPYGTTTLSRLKDNFLHKFNLHYNDFRNKMNDTNTPSFYLQDFTKVFYMAGDAMKIHYTQSFNVKTIVQPL